MLRYAALAVILSFSSQGIFCTAAGNIGCLFSETLCNQEKEWCYDDYAFGRCLPLYGNVREEDMHRYELGTGELHVLEQEMQRLFLLGYRWSHTYTQCVLQSLLKAIRNKEDFDVSSCNAELDQDLEGALKAIEGEEMEHIDPKNLAIVRFMPSVLNPHSDYADEMYYPPVEEMLPPYRGDLNKNDEGDEGENKGHEGNAEVNESSKNKSAPSPTIKDALSSSKVTIKELPKQPLEVPTAKSTSEDEPENNRIESQYNLPPPAIPMALFMDPQSDDPSVAMEGDYDYDVGYDLPYSFTSNPVYKRAGYLEEGPREIDEVDVGNYFRNKLRPRDLRELARMLSMIKPSERSIPSNQPPLYNKMAAPDRRFELDNQRYGAGRDQGYFREVPVAPSYRERLFPSLKEGKINIVSPYDNSGSRRMGPPGSQLPVLNPPVEEEVISPPDTIHSGFVKGFENAPPDSTHKGFVKGAENYQKDEGDRNNNYNNNKDKFYNSQAHYDNSVARFEKDPGSTFNYEGHKTSSSSGDGNRYKWMNDIKQENDKGNYRSNKDPQMKYDQPYGPPMNTMSQQQLPKDAYYGRPPYPPWGFNSYDYPEYPEYYDYGGDYVELRAPPPWNFQRDERLDVKKPGPFFKSANNYAFDYGEGGDIDGSVYPQGDDEWLSKLNPLQSKALLLPKLQQGKQDTPGKDGKQNPDQIPDLLLTEEGYVEALSNEQRLKGKSGAPKADLQVADKEGSKPSSATQPDSYVYISISGRFYSEREADQLVRLILLLVGLDMKYIQNLSVENNQVMFQVQENSLGMTAAYIAERTEELRSAIKEKTGMEITQAGVGTKSAMSAVVYSSGERQMLAVAAIVCGICAALLVAATVLFFMRRHARSKAKMQGLTAHDSEASKDYQDLCRARMAGKSDGKEPVPGQAHTAGHTPSGHAPGGQRISSLSKESDNGNNTPSSRSSTSSWSEEPVISNMDISTGHMVLSYMEDHLRNKDRLDQEWVALCAYEAEPCACNIALKPENAQKNRYSDVLPYDHNRVILNEHTNVSGSNYINASSITDHDPRNPAYISTQGPLASTAADFWQLVWEQGSVVIVMLTRLTENGQALCHRYWPEEGSELYHIYEVHLVSEHIWCDDYLVRSFYLKNVRTSETRTVTQFHFLSWPEAGVPASTKALLEFRRKVNKSYRGRSCPIIVHCSDGVGRAGTYCLIDMVLNRMAKGAKEIDIAATLEHIRDQRPNMVKTKIQFEFVLMAVAEEVHAILKALPQ